MTVGPSSPSAQVSPMWEYHLMSLQAQGAGATLGGWSIEREFAFHSSGQPPRSEMQKVE